ncbi:MAG: hypothetical protein GYA17_07020 [Chloroflexi bacterium]|jgi:transcription antitermination factor NusG|nr:hypothetical protein [Anaerolineaceae bacterium]NMB88093.1 hypothetical protein [Chloroflexota bacterium]
MSSPATFSDDPWRPGQKVHILSGPFAGMDGAITWIDRQAGTVRVEIDFFGRPTPVDLTTAAIRPAG